MKMNNRFIVTIFVVLLVAFAYFAGQSNLVQILSKKDVVQISPTPTGKPVRTPTKIPTSAPTKKPVVKIIQNTPVPTKPERIPVVINGNPWNPFTAYCDPDYYNTIQDAVAANNDMNDKLKDCLSHVDLITDHESADTCYSMYPVGEKDHIYAQILMDALTNYCGCSFPGGTRNCPTQ
jgi:hypothetical protein